MRIRGAQCRMRGKEAFPRRYYTAAAADAQSFFKGSRNIFPGKMSDGEMNWKTRIHLFKEKEKEAS